MIPRYTISVDTGGTFTDVIVRDASGCQTIGKALTTHDRVFSGLSHALNSAAVELDLDVRAMLACTDLFIYGTTRATNAIVTRNVARTAFLTTRGFPDVLVLKEGGKLDGYDFSRDFPRPYIARRHTFEVVERIGSQGEVVIPLDDASTIAVIRTLQEKRFEAVAVCFLWSIVNPAHELRVGDLLRSHLPGVPFTLSHALAPIIREYRRASATAIDASLKPLMQQHLRELEDDLRAAGYVNELLVSTSVGGVMHVQDVIEAPIHTAKSGPSMAPIAGIEYSVAEGLGNNMIVCDTGGTTFDVGLSRDGRPIYSRDTWLGGQWEGDLLGVSSVDIRSIGAGGGSIAWIDDGGLLQVGPQSAGSEPGPACYSRGGLQPTVSDAACVLGYLNPDYFLGGRMKLDVAAARRAMQRIATPLGMSPEGAAWGILSLASDLMIKAIHEITVAQGIDPRESTLVAGGGAAGINIMHIGAELGSDRIVLPKVASALSASGMQFADVVTEATASLITSSIRFDFEGVNATLQMLEERLLAFRDRIRGMEHAESRIEYLAEARYQAQVWELDTMLPTSRIRDPADLLRFVEAFHELHHRVFALRDEDSPVEVINWKARLIVKRAAPLGLAAKPVPRPAPVPQRRRSCHFGTDRSVETPIFRSGELFPGHRVVGPAIIEEPTTTLVVFPGMAACVSGAGNYVLAVKTERLA